MPVATWNEITWQDIDDPEFIDVAVYTCEHSNYPYDKPSFRYVNLM